MALSHTIMVLSPFQFDIFVLVEKEKYPKAVFEIEEIYELVFHERISTLSSST